jgi:glycosyltransferase involved in cell wall biosynthesis
VRILHLTDHYPPDLGGIEVHVAALAARQAARGDSVTVLTSTPASAEDRRGDEGGPVRVFRARTALGGFPWDVTQFDVVHAHVSVLAPFTEPMAALASRRVPTVVTVHSLWDRMGPVPAVSASISGLRRSPVQWTAVSHVAAAQLARHLGGGNRRILVLPNAVDVAPRDRPGPREGADPVRLVSTMRIARRKMPLQLVRAFAALSRSTTVPVHLTIIGDGPLRPRLERLVGREQLSDLVTVTGRLEPTDVPRVLAQADVYVAPAVLESFGIAALEARSVGLPVVGHAGSGLSEFVRNGVEGWLVASGTEMVDRLRDLVEQDDLRHRVSEHNRTTSSGMTWAHALERTDAAYAQAGASRAGTDRRDDSVLLAR